MMHNITSGMQDIGGQAWAKCMHVQDMQGAVAFTWLPSECDWAMGIVETCTRHIAATVSQAIVYSYIVAEAV